MGDVVVRSGATELPGSLEGCEGAVGVVVFAHGSGSSRFSPRNQAVAAALRRGELATLLFDLLTPQEASNRHNVFDIGLLGHRLIGALEWIAGTACGGLPVGLFGASTGAAAALVAAAEGGDAVAAVVSRGGRPDLAGAALPAVGAPTLLIVGSRDRQVLELNRAAAAQMTAPVAIEIVKGASHLFEEPGALDEVAALAAGWFGDHL